MKPVYFLVLLCILFTNSCAFVKSITSSQRFDFEKSVAINANIDEVVAKTGLPIHKLVWEKKDLYLFRTGYVEFLSGKVTRRGQYEYSYNDEQTFSSNVQVNADLFETCISFGLPKKISEHRGGYTVLYNNGAFLSAENKIRVIVDQLFSNDIVFNLGINAYSDKTSRTIANYFIMPGDKDVNPEDLQYKEVQSYMEYSLIEQGQTIVRDIKKADYILLLKYGISDPKEDIKVVSRPVFVPTYVPGQTANFYSGYNYVGSVQTAGRWGTQYAGQHTETIKTVSYNRWLNVEAFDNHVLLTTKTLKPVWKVLTNSVGSIGDIRQVIPALAYGAGNYINHDTQKQLDFRIQTPVLNEYVFESKLHTSQNSRSVAGKK